MSASLLRRRFITRTFYRSRVRKSSLKMEEAEAFPGGGNDDGRSLVDRRRNASTTHRATKRRHLAFAFLFGVVFASCFRRWWWYHHPSTRSSPFFFPSSSCDAAKAADGLRVKSRRKKPQGRVNEEDDFDRGERGDESGEKEEEKKRFFVTATILPAARGRPLNRFRGSRRSTRTWTRSRRTSCSNYLCAARERRRIYSRRRVGRRRCD